MGALQFGAATRVVRASTDSSQTAGFLEYVRSTYAGCLRAVDTTSKRWTARRRYLVVCLFNTLFSVIMGLLLPFALQNEWMIMPEYLRADCGIVSLGSGKYAVEAANELVSICIYRVSLRRGGVALMILFTAIAIGSSFDSRVHSAHWNTKYVCFVTLQSFLFLSQFVFTSTWMSDLWGIFDDVGRVAGASWLVVQGIVLLDLSHELHTALLLRARRAELNKQTFHANCIYSAHMGASVLLVLTTMTGLFHTLQFIVPQQCSSPYASHTAQLLVLMTAILGTCSSIAGLSVCVNKGLLIPSFTLAYQALICYSLITSDLCKQQIVLPSTVLVPSDAESRSFNMILSLPFASLASTVESVVLTLLHVVCIYTVATDQSKTLQKLVLFCHGNGGRDGHSPMLLSSTNWSSGSECSSTNSTDELSSDSVPNETSVAIDSHARRSLLPSISQGSVLTSPGGGDDDEYLFNYRDGQSKRDDHEQSVEGGGGYLSFRSTVGSSVPTRRGSGRGGRGAPLNDVLFHLALTLASGYVPLLLTNWDSPYGALSDVQVLHLWPRLAALALVWLLFAFSVFSSCAYYSKSKSLQDSLAPTRHRDEQA